MLIILQELKTTLKYLTTDNIKFFFLPEIKQYRSKDKKSRI